MALKPLNYADPMYQLLRDGNVKEFNRRKAAGERCDLTHCDLRNLDLRGLDAGGLDLSNTLEMRICAASTFPPLASKAPASTPPRSPAPASPPI
jgi:uncharacterized protein YjbI with pentapeptide repeats